MKLFTTWCRYRAKWNGKMEPLRSQTVIYDCEMWLEEDNMDELKVRGYIWLLFRTQTWLRQK